jgi:hypothetical protein
VVNVRFAPESGHQSAVVKCPLWAKLRHLILMNYGTATAMAVAVAVAW